MNTRNKIQDYVPIRDDKKVLYFLLVETTCRSASSFCVMLSLYMYGFIAFSHSFPDADLC